MLSPIWLRACLLFLAGCALCAPALAVGDADQARPKVLPVPKQLEPQPGYCTLAEGIALDVADPVLLEHARVFAEELRFLHGVDVVLGAEASAEERAGRVPLTLALREAATLGEDDPAAVVGERIDESYTLAVDPAAIRVEAATPTGIAWGTATLLQWIQVRSGLGPGAVCVRVADAPLAPYRAVLIDVARAPHSIEVLRGVVRAARLLKLRFVHLHLTDDQSFTLPFEPVTSQLTGNRAYTPAELRELVEYARVRGVVLIPEIDLPGHSGKLLQSGFLEGAQSHADVASEEHWEGVRAVIDAGIDAFPTSPYFHIGGDESGAGSALVPFLERVNAHVRSRGKRLLLWEGFHGAPLEAIPATGPDRVIVAAWESSYNAPWDLLDAGYTLVNASWKPLYVVGGHSRLHPGVSAGRKWQPEAIAHWHKDRFMHWEPGRPVYEGRGPGDADPLDREWLVPEQWRDQIVGGQLCFWEQRDSSVLGDLAERAPVLAERLWNGTQMADDILVGRLPDFVLRQWALVQPLGLATPGSPEGPMDQLGAWAPGENVRVRVTNRSRAAGEVRWSAVSLGEDWNWIDAKLPPPPAIALDDGSLELDGNYAVRFGLFDADGELLGSETHLRVFQWEPRVRVTEFDLDPTAWPRRLDPAPARFDFDGLPADARRANYTLPMLRGPLAHLDEHGQRLEATLVAPFDGPAQLGLKTQSGSAVLWLDLNRDGAFDEDERLLGPSPSSEARETAVVELVEGERYALRVDHLVRLPRPVLLVSLDEPGAERPAEISRHLEPLE
jgi:hypothetical protein